MPDHDRPVERAATQRAADHAGIAKLADALVPALVGRLGASGLGEVEVREGDWHVRVRRASGPGLRRPDRGHRTPLPIVAPPAVNAAASVSTQDDSPRNEAAVSPAVGIFKSGLAVGTRVRVGDRIAAVDLLGIAQDVVAPIDGTLVEVYPQAGDGVEYGEEVALVAADPESPDGGAGEG
jgi:biotin carboxyl carrier protein